MCGGEACEEMREDEALGDQREERAHIEHHQRPQQRTKRKENGTEWEPSFALKRIRGTCRGLKKRLSCHKQPSSTFMAFGLT